MPVDVRIRCLSPNGVLDACFSPDYYWFDGRAFDDADSGIDWCRLTDLAREKYSLLCIQPHTIYGFIDVDKPSRAGDGLFVATHHSDLFRIAADAAHMGLWWNIAERKPCIEATIKSLQGDLWSPMWATRRDTILRNIEQWKIVYPGDDRIIDFECYFVLDMLMRRRVSKYNHSMRQHEIIYEKDV